MSEINPDFPPTRQWEPLTIAESKNKNIVTYVNQYYLVNAYIYKEKEGGISRWTLAIYNHDRSAMRDWREFQKIKNEICGEETIGFEFYPPESVVLDNANVFIMYVLPKSDDLGFGFMLDGERSIKDQHETEFPQRRLNP